MTIIHIVDIAKFTAPTTGDLIGKVDVCRDDEGNIHIRMNDGHDEVVLKLAHHQARRVYNMIFKAVWP